MVVVAMTFKSCFGGTPRLVAVLLLLMASLPAANADTYLSNLGNRWEVPGSIGDIHGLFPGEPYPTGKFAVDFVTGDGSFLVNTLTLEFWSDSTTASATQWINIQLLERTGATVRLLGGFGNPVSNPMPTQWPDRTGFFDFSPHEEMRLKPFLQYTLVVSMPSESPTDAGLLFSTSSNYLAPSGWTMSSTRSRSPGVKGEYLKLAIDATLIPEPNAAILFITGFVVWIVRRRTFSGTDHEHAGV